MPQFRPGDRVRIKDEDNERTRGRGGQEGTLLRLASATPVFGGRQRKLTKRQAMQGETWRIALDSGETMLILEELIERAA
jgi:hypothetical protein